MGSAPAILWDFDNTLFQTKRFWREHLFPAFVPLGIHAEDAELAFKAATGGQNGNPDYFVPGTVAKELHKASGLDTSKLLAIVEGVTYSDLGRWFFFDDALSSVRVSKQKGYENLLLSYGDHTFKTRWFESIGILDYFDPQHVHITNTKKGEMVHTLTLPDSVVIVNDVMKETKALLDTLQTTGHTVAGYHFVPDSDKLKDEPQEVGVTNFSSFTSLIEML